MEDLLLSKGDFDFLVDDLRNGVNGSLDFDDFFSESGFNFDSSSSSNIADILNGDESLNFGIDFNNSNVNDTADNKTDDPNLDTGDLLNEASAPRDEIDDIMEAALKSIFENVSRNLKRQLTMFKKLNFDETKHEKQDFQEDSVLE